MGMTMSQKILAAHAGVESVKPGQLIMADLDLCLGNDITTPVAINEFEKAGFDAVFDKDKIALVMDHFAPNKDIKAAEQCKQCRQFAAKHKITHYYDVGCMGVEHALLPEQGLVTAGELVIGADSHTCTYGALGAFSTGVGSTDLAAGIARGKAWFKVPEAIKFVLTGKKNPWVSGKDIILHIIGLIGVDGALYQSMEFTGDGLAQLTIDDRLCMANMAIEAGAKNGIFEVDEITLAYLKEREKKAPTVYRADDDAEYSQVFEIDLAAVQPTVALPHLPENTKTVAELGEVRLTRWLLVPAPMAVWRIWRWRPKFSRAKRWRRACASSLFRPLSRFTNSVCSWVIWKPLSTRAARFPHPPAALAWAVIWAFWRMASVAWPPPTAILWAAWATPPPRLIWLARLWRRPAP